MVGENDSASTETTGLTHDWSPVAEQLFKVSTTRAVTPHDVASNSLLWDGVYRSWSLDLNLVTEGNKEDFL